MIAVLSLLSLLVLSLVITRIATIALMFTGMSRDSARFQARSAFTGVGFTTSEAEGIVQHPVRRRIVMLLMLLGNVGIVTVVSSAIISFVRVFGDGIHPVPFAILIGGLTAFVMLVRSRWVERRMSQTIEWALRRWTDLEVYDYANLLHLSGEYGISEVPVEESDWMAGKSLADLRLRDEGLIIIGIQHPDGTYIGAPNGTSMLHPGDVAIVYGPTARIAELDDRESGAEGDQRHERSVESQQETIEEQIVDREREAMTAGVDDKP